VKLLLDTHILLALGRGELRSKYPKQNEFISKASNERLGSVASLWEIAIKVGLEKLDLGMSPLEFSNYLAAIGIIWLPVTPTHATFQLLQQPQTRDPFDRMLLSQCAVEDMKLVTVDRLLLGHPNVLVV
jgi:PIN domain nuclease of toxin-antitoxin system